MSGMEELKFGPNTPSVNAMLDRLKNVDWFSAESFSEQGLTLLREHLDRLRPFGYGRVPLWRVDRNAFVVVAIAQKKLELEWDIEDPVQEMYQALELPPDAPQPVVDVLIHALEWEMVKDRIDHPNPWEPLVRVLEMGNWFEHREDGLVLCWRGESEVIR